MGKTLRETPAPVRSTSDLPAGSWVVVYDYRDDAGRWFRLPAYSTDAGQIPALMAALLERLFSFAMWTDGQGCLVNEMHHRQAATVEVRSVEGRTLSEALCRAVVALAEREKGAEGDGEA